MCLVFVWLDAPSSQTHHSCHRRRARRLGSAAWQAANAGVPVILHEMRRCGSDRRAQDRDKSFAELVCSNSFRSDDAETQRRRPAA
jgi:hypothetical protein